MKTLQLIRHAKSAWDVPGLADRDRGLKPRGLRESPLMGVALAGRPLPDAVYVSPARRAQMTLAGLCEGWTPLSSVPGKTEEALYTFAVDDLFEWLVGLPPRGNTVLLVSHNPAMTDLVNLLVGEGWLDNLPTAGYVELGLHVDHWREVMQGCAEITYSLFPRELPQR